METDSCFLTLDEDQPLGIFIAYTNGAEVVDLDSFLEESKVDMSKDQAHRYIDRLQLFVDELSQYANA